MDWTSPGDWLLFLALMGALLLFRAWNTNRKMRPLRALFDGGQYERRGTGLIDTRYIGRYKGRRAAISYDPRGWGRPGNFDLEIACRAPWGFYARTLGREKIIGWSNTAGQEVDLGDPGLAGKIGFYSDTPGELLRWLADPEARAAVAHWILEEDAIYIALRPSRRLGGRALAVAYANTLPPRTEANVRVLMDRLDWLAGKAEGG